MIGSLRGTLLDRQLRHESKDAIADVLVECYGVGYRVAMSSTSAQRAGDIGKEVFLYIYTNVREDAITLFGFVSREERECFAVLIATHGIGPSMALAILATFPASELASVIHNNDVDALCSVPGIGKKTAAKLLVALQSRIDLPVIDVSRLGESSGTSVANDARFEVRSALLSLGYSQDEVRAVTQEFSVEGDVQSMLRDALRKLAVRV